jgi:peroxiredoxin
MPVLSAMKSNNRNIFLSILLFLFAFTIQAQKYSIRYSVKGLNIKKAYLLSVYGSRYDLVDSCKVINGEIVFSLSDSVKPGVYRLSFADSLYTDFIYNHENVVMSNNMINLSDNLVVNSSEENRVFYAYWKMSKFINDTVNLIAKTGDAMYEASKHILTHALDSMQHKAWALNKRLNEYSDSLILKSSALLVSNIIKAYRVPDYLAYLKTPGTYPYQTQLDFLRDHYFDNVDLTDNRLLHTEVIYVTITDYLNTFGDPPSTENYNRAIDTILKRIEPNKEMKDYALNLLLNTFETSSWEKVFVHLIDTWVIPNSCEIDGAQQYIQKSDAIKNLETGKPAPPVSINDINGKPVALYDIKSPVTLIFFWSSDCPHCHSIMPELAALYDSWHSKGLEIYAISIDTDFNAWTEAVKHNGMKCINVSDLKGLDSEVLIQYNTWRTPSFFLLDAEKKIISRPLVISQIRDNLELLLK